jgi:hypothetical protein
MEKLNRLQESILLALYKYDPLPLKVEEIEQFVVAEGLLLMTEEDFREYGRKLVELKDSLTSA